MFPPRLPEGIDCQRCHGPGQDHVQTQKPGSIVNPARLNSERQMEICMQCQAGNHQPRSSGGVEASRPRSVLVPPWRTTGKLHVAFRSRSRHGTRGQLELVSSVYRLRKSKCLLESGGALTCTTCHNPHRDARMEEYVIANALGQVYSRQGRLREAVSAFRKALALNPDMAEAANNLGNTLAQLGDVTAAEEALRKAVLLRPEVGAMRLNLANLLSGQENFLEGLTLAAGENLAEAQQAFEAVKYAPDLLEAYLRLGEVLRALGQSALARPHLQKAGDSPDPRVRKAATDLLGSTK